MVYGGTGEIKSDALPRKPRAGHHFVGVKIGLKNFGAGVYSRNVVLATAATNDRAAVSHAIALGKKGLGKVTLRHNETAYGQVFFELEDHTRIRTLRFRPFPTSTKKATFFTRAPGRSASGSSKPLPTGGSRRIVRSGKRTVRAVLYGVAGKVDKGAVDVKPHAGSHFVSVSFGLANLGAKAYFTNLALTTSIKDTNGNLSRAVPAVGLGKITLASHHTAKGRIIFELRNGTRLRSLRFRPFGPKGKLAVFTVRKNA